MIAFTVLLQAAGQVAQEAAKAVTTIPPGPPTEVVPYFTTALGIVATQKWLKTSWLTKGAYGRFVERFPGADVWAHRFVAFCGAASAALGLHWIIEGNPDVGYHVQLITPAVEEMLHGLGDLGRIYMLQWGAYEMMKKGGS